MMTSWATGYFTMLCLDSRTFGGVWQACRRRRHRCSTPPTTTHARPAQDPSASAASQSLPQATLSSVAPLSYLIVSSSLKLPHRQSLPEATSSSVAPSSCLIVSHSLKLPYRQLLPQSTLSSVAPSSYVIVSRSLNLPYRQSLS